MPKVEGVDEKLKMYGVTSRHSDKMQWMIEIPRQDFEESPHNHKLYRDLMECSSVAENIRALLLVCEARQQLEHEECRAEVKQQMKKITELENTLLDKERQVRRLAGMVGADEDAKPAGWTWR